MRQCTINTITIGGDAPVRVMGVINCSPESFYVDSYIPTKEIHTKAVEMVEAGADMHRQSAVRRKRNASTRRSGNLTGPGLPSRSTR